jgi:ribosomal protein S18 acetylase RimI-like enzyme
LDRIALEKAGPGDIESLARWISESGEAPTISALETCEVRPSDVAGWLKSSLEGFIIRVNEEPVALGTLSTSEAPLPAGTVEVCHVIVRPDWRRRFKGTQLVTELMARARGLGFRWVVGRVVPSNGPSHGFLQWLDWRPTKPILTADDPRFVWYQRLLDP